MTDVNHPDWILKFTEGIALLMLWMCLHLALLLRQVHHLNFMLAQQTAFLLDLLSMHCLWLLLIHSACQRQLSTSRHWHYWWPLPRLDGSMSSRYFTCRHGITICPWDACPKRTNLCLVELRLCYAASILRSKIVGGIVDVPHLKHPQEFLVYIQDWFEMVLGDHLIWRQVVLSKIRQKGM